MGQLSSPAPMCACDCNLHLLLAFSLPEDGHARRRTDRPAQMLHQSEHATTSAPHTLYKHTRTHFRPASATLPWSCMTDEVVRIWFVLLTLIPVNDALTGKVCSAASHYRRTRFTIHPVTTARCVRVPLPRSVNVLPSVPRGSSYGNFWAVESLNARWGHTHSTGGLIDMHAGASRRAHSFKHAHGEGVQGSTGLWNDSVIMWPDWNIFSHQPSIAGVPHGLRVCVCVEVSIKKKKKQGDSFNAFLCGLHFTVVF